MTRTLFSAAILAVSSLGASAVPTEDEAVAAYRTLLGQLSLERVLQTYRDVERFGSRLPGSPGEQKTLEYAEEELRRIGFQNIRREEFKVTVPETRQAVLTVGGRSIPVKPLWPNLVRTNTCDVSGLIVYGRDGTLEQLQGKSIKGSIVVLEFNSGANWRNAIKLGAKAVIFLEPKSTTRSEAEAKFSSVPLTAPRFYVPMDLAGPVLNAAVNGQSGRLVCRQDWVERTTYNLIADLPGTVQGPDAERIVLLGFIDSMSVVPDAAPGAESIGNLAAILELSRLWKQMPARRTLQVVVSSAHFLALQGAREYVERRFTDPADPASMTLTLDLSSGSPGLGSYGRGWFYDYRNEPLDSIRQMSRTFRAHADRLATVLKVPQARQLLTDAVNDGDNRTWKNNIPGKFAFDCEPILNSGIPAISMVTIEDARDRVDTPFDTVDRVNAANVFRQIQTLAVMTWHVLNDTSDRHEVSNFRVPVAPSGPRRMSLVGGFTTAQGTVSLYDPQRSFVPDTHIQGSLAANLGRHKSLMGVRGDMIQLTRGERAEYRFVGLAPQTSYWHWWQPYTRLAAFRLDPETGEIDHAPSMGVYGAFSFPITFQMALPVRTSPIVVFPSVSVALFDLVDPQELRAIENLRVLDAVTGAEPQDYGLFAPGFDTRLNPEIEDVQVLFLRKGTRFKILGSSQVGETRLILTNSSLNDEEGKGYSAPGDETQVGRSGEAMDGIFSMLPLNTAKDLSGINRTRLERFDKYRIISPDVLRLQELSEGEIAKAEESLMREDWPAAERHARAAWGYALRAHPVIQGTSNDVINGVVFYLFLLLPFSYFMERLVVASRMMVRQLVVTIGIFMAAFVLLRFIHPAFEIVTNPSMIFVAFVMGTLSLIVISFILGKFESSMRMVKQAQSGVKEVDIRRGSVAAAAFNLGVSNMRRRKARTILTTLTLVVMTFIVLSFTSIVSEVQLNEFPSETEARFPGLLVRNPGMEPLQLTTYRQLKSEFGETGTVVRRAYYYGADIGDHGILTLKRADRFAEVRAMVGLEPEETAVLRPQEALVAGRWFREGELDVMILPTPLAQQLKVEPNEVGKAKVSYAGRSYLVVGIVDPSIMRSMIDLDGDELMPPDFSLSRRQQVETATTTQAFRSFIRLDPGVCFIVPAQTALNLGADLRNLAVRFEDANATREELQALMPRLRLNLYASVPKEAGSDELEVRQFSVFQATRGTGIGLILVQLAIAAVFVLNTMVASVYERTREIGIFSSIGLAPNHIAMLFFAESLVYGVLGSVIGYFMAQGTAKFIVATDALPGLTLNFSSTSAVMSAGLVMATVLGSTIYPARKAAQIAAPAMNEEVFKTDPDGDEWVLPLPFSISAVEAAPLMRFLGEWFLAYEEYTIGDFVSSQTKISADPSPEGVTYAVQTVTWLAPYDLGISQQLSLIASPSAVPGVYHLDLRLTRLGGDPENWPVVNRRFLANLRKQFLTWRALDAELRIRFEERARETFETGIQKSEAQPVA